MKLFTTSGVFILLHLFFSCSTESTTREFFGCTNPDACNYDPQATLDNGQCDVVSCNRVFGCMDDRACNFNPEANTEDNMCEYGSGTCGCTDSEARNYNRNATEDNGSCDYRCTKEATIRTIDVAVAPVETAQIKFEVLVDGELALRTINKEYVSGMFLQFRQEDYEVNREGDKNSIRFSGENDGTFTVRIYVNDILAESTTYDSCYALSLNESSSLPNQYWIGGFDCPTVEVDCDFSAYIAFSDVEL